MKIAAIICRIFLGLLFTFAGGFGLYLVISATPMPQPPGLAGDFQHVFFASHWVLFVQVIQLIGGILLLINRFVPLALLMLAGVIYNIIVYHITMQPAQLPFIALVVACWIVVALRHRTSFEPLLRA